MVSLKWLGHAAWLIKFENATVIVDPFLTGNPKAAMKAEDVKADFVLVTHTHSDHLGDAFEITKKNNAKLVTKFELSLEAMEAGVSEENTVGMNIGNLVNLGPVSIAMVPAVHSGNENGFVIVGDGKSIYHAGDTGLFGDMKLIGEMYHPDVSLLPIGGFYTMGPLEAAKAAEFLGSDKIFPMHYSTFPGIEQDPEELRRLVHDAEVVIMQPGQEHNL